MSIRTVVRVCGRLRRLCVLLRRELEAAVTAARSVADPRAWGHPEVVGWAEIGEDLGVSRQAAQKRWKRVDEPWSRALPADD